MRISTQNTVFTAPDAHMYTSQREQVRQRGGGEREGEEGERKKESQISNAVKSETSSCSFELFSQLTSLTIALIGQKLASLSTQRKTVRDSLITANQFSTTDLSPPL